MRSYNRKPNQLRPVEIIPGYLKFPAGSVLIKVGQTEVLCNASIDEGRVPSFLEKLEQGWITAEYSMLPASTPGRSQREASRGRVGGRTHEIQRLIGRVMRTVVDLKALGQRTIWIDCDVLQADGGTRTAAITGAFVALAFAIKSLIDKGKLSASPLRHFVAAVSVGVVDGKCLLDLDYVEDSKAEVDMNMVMTGKGDFIELQGTAEREPFGAAQMDQMVSLAKKGIRDLIKVQKSILGKIL